MESEQIKGACLNFLRDKERLTAALATAGSDGTPRASVVYYFADEDFNFYFLTATDTQKYKNLLENSKASIAVGFGPAYVTIQGQGTAELLPKGSEEENVAIALIKERLQGEDYTWPVFQLDDSDDESIAVFKLTPSSLQVLNLEKDNGLPVTTDDIQQII